MDTESLISIVVLGSSMAAIILLSSVVLLRNTRERLHRSFFALSLSAAFWVLTNLVFSVVHQHDIQYAAALASYGAGGLLGLFFMRYCIDLARVRLKRTYSTLSYAVGFAVAVASVTPGVLATGVSNNSILTIPLVLMLYGIYEVIFIGTGLYILVTFRAKARGVERSKLTIVLFGLVVAAIVGMYFNLFLPMFGDYRFINVGPVATLVFVATSTYAIVRHHLFDIKLAAVRTITYAGALLTLSGVYYALAYVFSLFVFNGGGTFSMVGSGPLNISLALILAFLFQPIKRFFDRITNDIFYRQEYKSDEFFADLSTLLSSTIDLRGLLEQTSGLIADTFKSAQAFFFLYDTEDETHHMSAGTRGHAKMAIADARMLDYFCSEQASTIFLTDDVGDRVLVERMLKSHRIALVMPLKQDDKITGYLVLGDHLSGNYTKRDLNILTTISSEIVIAISNALSLHEVKELNATLQQRINVATKELRSSNAQLKHLDEVKDEFMSMASHQLRTPLTSIKGHLSMVLEGDAGNVTARQQQLLVEAFKSSERMVRLIADFLNVSRLQTGKFVIEKTPFDIRDAVVQEVKNLEMIARSHEIKLKFKVDKHALPVEADEQKIRQVIMNFIDNAIYYSHPGSTIVVHLERVKNDIAFTVVDTGIGVPDEEQHRLFTKFYRAPNARKARPDGTGVGLYLARRVIAEHDGTIIFSSKENKGSTFGFRLPQNLSPVPVARPTPEPVATVASK